MHVHTCAAINSTPFPFQDLNQYLILVDDAEEEEQEESVDRLFECLDTSSSENSSVSGGSGSGKKKKKKGGKDKKDVKKVKKAWEALAQKHIELEFCTHFKFSAQDKKSKKGRKKTKKTTKSKTEKEKNENEDPTEEEKRKQLGKDAKKAGYYAKVSSAHMHASKIISCLFRQALNDASTKLKWAIGLMPNLDKMRNPQYLQSIDLSCSN